MHGNVLATLVALLVHICYHNVCSEGVSYIRLGSGSKVLSKVFIGGLFPIHAADNGVCGTILDLGIQRQEAMVYAVNKINNDPALLRGVTLAFEIMDTCTSISKVLEDALKFITVQRTIKWNLL